MATFDIMFDDLRDDIQKEFLEFQGLKNVVDGNYDVFPIAVIERDDDEVQTR